MFSIPQGPRRQQNFVPYEGRRDDGESDRRREESTERRGQGEAKRGNGESEQRRDEAAARRDKAAARWGRGELRRRRGQAASRRERESRYASDPRRGSSSEEKEKYEICFISEPSVGSYVFSVSLQKHTLKYI